MRSIIKDKKGGYLDIFLFMIFALIIVVISVLFVYMGGQIKDKLHLELDNKTEVGSNVNYSETIDASMGAVSNAYGSLYWISVFLILGMIIAIFMGSYLVTTKPVYFVPYIFVVGISIIVAVGISNGYAQIIENSTLSSTFDGFIGANFLLLNLPIIITIVGFVGGIIMFIKMTRGQEYEQGFY